MQMKTYRDMKKCPRCGVVKPLSAFYSCKHTQNGVKSWCKECDKANKRDYYNNRGGKKKHKILLRRYALKTKYGLSEQEWLELLRKQNGKCAICGVSYLGLKRNFHTDHNHKTGIVRGLLCGHCNYMLGMVGENTKTLKQAIKYLENTSV